MANRGIKGIGKIRKMNSKKKQITEESVKPFCDESGCGCGN